MFLSRVLVSGRFLDAAKPRVVVLATGLGQEGGIVLPVRISRLKQNNPISKDKKRCFKISNNNPVKYQLT
jgi:hypothetical protein